MWERPVLHNNAVSKTVLNTKGCFFFLIKRRDIIKVFYKDLLENMLSKAEFLQSNHGRNYDNLKQQHSTLNLPLTTPEGEQNPKAICRPYPGPGMRECLSAERLTSCTYPAGQPGFWPMTWHHRRAH